MRRDLRIFFSMGSAHRAAELEKNMTKSEAAKICKSFRAGMRVVLKGGLAGVVVDVDAERGCLWIYPDNGSNDIRVWASQVQI